MQSKHNKQKGYAAVLTLVLFSALSLSLFAMFNSGQIVTHKLKLQNAVDAATYSSSTIIAREMNYMAYSNRAIVANQVIVGQMVGLSSWNKQMIEVGKNLKKASKKIKWVPYVGKFADGLATALKAMTNGMDKWLKLANIPNAIKAQQKTIKALTGSQTYVHLATGVIFSRNYPKVLEDNNKPDINAKDKIYAATILPAGLDILLPNYDRLEKVNIPKPASKSNSSYASTSGTQTKENQDLKDFKRLETVIKRSDDGFVGTKYDWGRTNYWGFGLYNRGGNEFEMKENNGKYQWEWSAMDTVSFHFAIKVFGHCLFCYTKPVGWGAAYAADDKPYEYQQNYNKATKKVGMWGNAFKHPTGGAAKKAIKDYGDNKLSDGVSLLPFYKYRNKGQEVIGPEFVAAASKSQEGVRTRNSMVKDHTGNDVASDSPVNIEKNGNMSGNKHKLYAIAKAQVYFARSFEKDVVTASKNTAASAPKERPASKVQEEAESNAAEEIKKYDTDVLVRVTDDEGNTKIESHKHAKEDDCIKERNWSPLHTKRQAWLSYETSHYKCTDKDNNLDWVWNTYSCFYSGSRQDAKNQHDIDKLNMDLNLEEQQRYSLDVCESIPTYQQAVKEYTEKEQREWQRKVKAHLKIGPASQFSRAYDNNIEYANLFNPYWQVRLSDYSDIEKLTAMTILGTK